MQVEFIDGDDEPETSDELIEPTGRRRRWPIPVAVAALLATVATLLIARSGQEKTPVAQASPPASRHALPFRGSVPLMSLPPQVATGPDLDVDPGLTYRRSLLLSSVHCPARGVCTIYPQVSPTVVRAVADALPGVRIGDAATTTADGRLWFRQVHASDGRLMVVVEVSRPMSATTSRDEREVDAAAGTALIRRRLSGFVVLVRVSGARGTRLPVTALATLAQDRRLVLA